MHTKHDGTDDRAAASGGRRAPGEVGTHSRETVPARARLGTRRLLARGAVGSALAFAIVGPTASHAQDRVPERVPDHTPKGSGGPARSARAVAHDGSGVGRVGHRIVTGALPGTGGERIREPAAGAWAARGVTTIGTRLRAVVRMARGRAADDRATAGPRLAVTPAALSPTTVQGTLRLAAVMVDYANERSPSTEASVGAHLFGGGTPSDYTVTQYYAEASRGLLRVTGGVAARVGVPRSSAWYVGTRGNGAGVADSLRAFLRDVTTQLTARSIDWSAYTDPEDTPARPGSGDMVRRVSGLVLLHAGPGGPCDNGATAIWPHRWRLGAALGAPILTGQRTTSGTPIVLDDYIVQSANDCDARGLAPNGVVIHEVGHLLGLPDLYNTEAPSGGDPVGVWDLMSAGNYLDPKRPTLLGAWSRVFLGWQTPTVIDVAAAGSAGVASAASRATARAGSRGADAVRVALPPAQDDGAVALVPFRGTNEVALLEYRAGVGTDGSLWPGLVIWYVDPDVVRQGLGTNRVNTSLARPGVAVYQADGQDDLERGSNRGDAGDPFPGTRGTTALRAAGRPAFRSRVTLNGSGAAIEEIVVEQPGSDAGGGSARGQVRFAVRPDTTTSSTTGTLLVIAPDTLPVLVGGIEAEVRLSVVGAGPGEAPGGATRSFRWSVDSVGAGRLGLRLVDSIQGVLRGVATTRDTLVGITVRVQEAGTSRRGERTFSVRVAQAPVTEATTLVRALLDPGRHPLSPAALQYLDLAGNRNGGYDLGDLVMLARRGIVRLSPEALRAARAPAGGPFPVLRERGMETVGAGLARSPNRARDRRESGTTAEERP